MNINKQALITPNKLELPFSWVGHIPFASWLVNHLKPKVFVELGTHSGNSYFSFCQSIQKNNLNTKTYAVDTWKGDEHAGLYGDEIWQDVKAYNDEHYAAFSTLIKKTFDDAINDFEDGSIDLLHIDGLHTYEAVKHDFEIWLPKLSSRGVVLFHDTVVKERGFGVYKLWDELEQEYSGFNFLHSHGLGVLLVGKDSDAALKELSKNRSQFESFKELFEILGDKVSTLAVLNEAVVDRDGQIADQSEHIEKVEADWEARGKVIADQGEHIEKVEADWEARGEVITQLEQSLSEQTRHLRGVEADWEARGKVINSLEKESLEKNKQLELVESELRNYQ